MNKIKQLPSKYRSVLHRNFREMIDYCAETYKDNDAFILKNKRGKEVSYERISFRTFRTHVHMLGTGMLSAGLRGKRVAVIGANSYEWVLSYFATLGGIGICVPLDRALPYDEIEISLIRSRADVLIFDKGLVSVVEELGKNNRTQVKQYICMNDLPGFMTVRQLMIKGRAETEKGCSAYAALPVDEKATTIILFTSGTTSIAKAVRLSQYNILANTCALLQVEDICCGDRTMAFLPYHHTFGSTGQVVMLAAGVTTTYCDGLKYIQKNIVEYKITLFIGVPLLIEAIYRKILSTAKKQGKEKKLASGVRLCNFLMKFGIDVRRRVFKEIIDQLGGRLRFVISGASALNPEVMKGFLNFGVEVVQGYGLTETSPVLSAETSKNRRIGSIGCALPGIDLKVHEPDSEGIGELIARGPNIMSGYYENQEETDKAIVDGWLHTGDLVSVDKDGYIFLRGRKKNVIVLKNGKNIYPEELEILISDLPYAAESMVYGEPRFKDGSRNELAVCVKIVYDPDYMKEYYGAETPEEIERVINRDVESINGKLPAYKRMFRITITDKPLIKTTTGKVKRFEEIHK